MIERACSRCQFGTVLTACAWLFVATLPVSVQAQSASEVKTPELRSNIDTEDKQIVKLEQLRIESAKLATDLETAQAELAASGQRSDALNEQNVSLKGTLSNLRTENSELQTKVADLASERDKLQASLAETEGTLERSHSELSALKTKLEASQKEVSALQSKVGSSARETAAQQKSLDEAAVERGRMQRRTDEMNVRIEDLIGEHRNTQAAFMQAKEKAKRIRQKVAPGDGGSASLEAATDAAGKANKAYRGAYKTSKQASDDPAARSTKDMAANQLDASQFLIARITGAAGIYRVRPGDTLAIIAGRTIGDSRLWQRIYDANQHILEDSDSLVPGQPLVIP